MVELPEGLKTDGAKTIEFKRGIERDARVITEDIRLIHRLFFQIQEALK